MMQRSAMSGLKMMLDPVADPVAHVRPQQLRAYLTNALDEVIYIYSLPTSSSYYCLSHVESPTETTLFSCFIVTICHEDIVKQWD